MIWEEVVVGEEMERLPGWEVMWEEAPVSMNQSPPPPYAPVLGAEWRACSSVGSTYGVGGAPMKEGAG
jgi:hypothetical protein